MQVNFIKQAKASIQQLVPYEPGKPIEEVARELGISPSEIIKLASNENPMGASLRVLATLNDITDEDVFRYPDGNGFLAKQALANHLDVETGQITMGNGSDELLRLIAMAYSGPDDEVVFSRYAFVIYKIAALSSGAKPVEVPGSNWGHDLDAMAKAVNENTRIIYIANPNNPTGTWIANQDILSFMERIPSHVLVVLDEAYAEYIEQTAVTETPSWIERFPNLVVTRTFSKAYGLAGLRMGYMAASPDVTDIINRIRPAFNLGSIAQKVIPVALKDQEHVIRSRQMNKEGMEQLEHAFNNMKLDYIASRANFITVDTGRDANKIFQQLLARGVIVRPLAAYGMSTWLRISVGLPDENEAFIEAMEAVLN